MTTKRHALSAFEQSTRHLQRKRPTVSAVLGNGDGSTVVCDAGSRMHWVRIHGKQSMLTRAVNKATEPVYGLAVEVVMPDRATGQAYCEVVGTATHVIAAQTGDSYAPIQTEEFYWLPGLPGRYAVNISARNLAPGRVYPTSPPSMRCRVAPLDYIYRNQAKYFGGGYTADFTTERPAAGLAKLAYVCIDGATNTLAYVYGAAFPWASYADPPPASARAAIPEGYVVLSAILLHSGMTSIVERAFTYEVRPLFAAVGDLDELGDLADVGNGAPGVGHLLQGDGDSWVSVDPAGIDASAFGSGEAPDGYVLTANGSGGTAWEEASGAPGGEADDFLELTDTPASYADQAGRYVKVNAAANALEFVAGAHQVQAVKLTDGNRTTASTTFVDLSGASITLTTSGQPVLLLLTCVAQHDENQGRVNFDFAVDGTRVSGCDIGLSICRITSANYATGFSMTWLVASLAAGEHTFKVQWSVDSGTGLVLAWPTTCPLVFTAIELK